jgi:putative lipoprotein
MVDKWVGRAACAVVALLFSACQGREANPDSNAQENAPPQTQRTTFAYECEDGSYVVAQLRPESDDVFLFLPSESLRLPQVPSGSGARYSDGTVTFWTEGREALVGPESGELVSCRENRRRSIIEDAKLRGNDFWATGNEPGWTLEIGPQTTVFVTNYGQERYEFPTPEAVVDGEARSTIYRGSADGADIVIRILGQPCQDSMADESYESTVEIRVDGNPLNGCGMALH